MTRTTSPYAFAAVVSITVIGLYIAYVIPVYLRWRKGDTFIPGPWTLGRKYKWVNPAAVDLGGDLRRHLQPPADRRPGSHGTSTFDWKFFNYAPVTVLVVIIAVGAWWLISARNTFTGPIRQVATDETGRVLEGRRAGRRPARRSLGP